MEFETVYKLAKISELPKDEKDNVFLTEKERGKLNQSTEKYKLLFFLKESTYHIFHDFPAIGTSRTVFSSSSIEGPFVLPPEVEEKRDFIDREYPVSIIKKFFPADKVPASFEEVELINYGTRVLPEFTSFIRQCDRDFNEKKIIEIGQSTIKKLEETCQGIQKVTVFGRPIYKTLINNCAVEFHFSEEGFHYPNINISVFGLKEKPREIIRELGVSDLEDAFGVLVRDIGLEHWVKEGLAYDFLIQKNLDIGKLLEAENIII